MGAIKMLNHRHVKIPVDTTFSKISINFEKKVEGLVHLILGEMDNLLKANSPVSHRYRA
jgi:hypothetical protein